MDSSDPKSYRPISNLSVQCKLLERLVSKQLVVYLLENDLFPDLQSAHRSNHSMELAVPKILSDILLALDFCHCWTCQLPLTASTTTLRCKDYRRLTVWAGTLSPGSPLILLGVYSRFTSASLVCFYVDAGHTVYTTHLTG